MGSMKCHGEGHLIPGPAESAGELAAETPMYHPPIYVPNGIKEVAVEIGPAFDPVSHGLPKAWSETWRWIGDD
jgi:hypothetical protein